MGFPPVRLAAADDVLVGVPESGRTCLEAIVVTGGSSLGGHGRRTWCVAGMNPSSDARLRHLTPDTVSCRRGPVRRRACRLGTCRPRAAPSAAGAGGH